MNVYLVEDYGNSPGKIYAVLAHKEDAQRFADAISGATETEAHVVERSLIYGQPPHLGYNP